MNKVNELLGSPLEVNLQCDIIYDNTSNIISNSRTNRLLNLENINNTKLIKTELLQALKKQKKKLKESLFIVSTKYDKINKKYNFMSILIMIISAVMTNIEAFRLMLTEYLVEINSTIKDNIETIRFSVNVVLLVFGTIITILSSAIRFRNYKDKMEKLKNGQSILFKYKMLYDKQKDLILYFNIDELDNKFYKKFQQKIDEYNKEIKDLNILEDIRNEDILKIKKYKSLYDCEIEKIKKNKKEILNKLKA